MGKLNQIIASEKSVKSKAHAAYSDLYKILQKPELFSGFVKTYEKKDEEGEDLPQEQKRVQYHVEEVLRSAERSFTEVIDIAARKDWTNSSPKARASVKVGDVVLIEDAPVTFLLSLEKTIGELRAFVAALPILDMADNWKRDANDGFYKTHPVSTHRTKKTQRALVLYPATPEHPAQTQLVTEDIIAGFWRQIKISGATPSARKAELLARVDALLVAIKSAREEANLADEVKVSDIGTKIFAYVLGDTSSA